MEKVNLILRSRTFWSIVGMFFVGGVNQVVPLMPADTALLVQGALGILATYFKLAPSQKY